MHNLLLPVLDKSEAIPERQKTRAARCVRLGPETAEDRFLISLAVLSILAEIAETAPLLCLIDDAQWLDGPSADALTFAARRVQAEGVIMLFARGTIQLNPLSHKEYRSYNSRDRRTAAVGRCCRTSGAPVAAPVRDRLVAGTGVIRWHWPNWPDHCPPIKSPGGLPCRTSCR